MFKIRHPDKNPSCTHCHEKFNQIVKAYETLIDESKQGDNKSKGVFRSNTVHLTMNNYHKLVEESNDFWVILVYENTRGNQYTKHVIDVWDEVANKYKNLVKFGAIDVVRHDKLLHFLPYKFQFFPNIVTYLHGEDSELFSNFDTFSPKSNFS